MVVRGILGCVGGDPARRASRQRWPHPFRAPMISSPSLAKQLSKLRDDGLAVLAGQPGRGA